MIALLHLLPRVQLPEVSDVQRSTIRALPDAELKVRPTFPVGNIYVLVLRAVAEPDDPRISVGAKVAVLNPPTHRHSTLCVGGRERERVCFVCV